MGNARVSKGGNLMLIHDKPRSQGVENVLKRARQMTEFLWTPMKKCPVGLFLQQDKWKEFVRTYIPAWLPQKGLIYSSVRHLEKFIGYNVSFETFVSALTNLESVVYARPQDGGGMRNYYGIICTVFVGYALNTPLRKACYCWPYDAHVTRVDDSDLNGLQLCDIILDPTRHIAMVTDIERDPYGEVRYITVSEGTLPTCRVTRFSVNEFRGYWLEQGYSIFRHDGLDDVPYTPSPFVPLDGDPPMMRPEINSALMPDFGNRANYMAGEQVELNVLEAGWENVLVTGPETQLLEVSEGKARFQPEKSGFYTAYCVSGDLKSDTVEFCVTDMELEADRATCKPGDGVTVTFRTEDEPVGWIIHETGNWDYRGGAAFTAEEKAQGVFTVRKAGRNADPAVQLMEPDHYQIFVLAKNKYGVYKSRYLDVCVTE